MRHCNLSAFVCVLWPAFPLINYNVAQSRQPPHSRDGIFPLRRMLRKNDARCTLLVGHDRCCPGPTGTRVHLRTYVHRRVQNWRRSELMQLNDRGPVDDSPRAKRSPGPMKCRVSTMNTKLEFLTHATGYSKRSELEDKPFKVSYKMNRGN